MTRIRLAMHGKGGYSSQSPSALNGACNRAQTRPITSNENPLRCNRRRMRNRSIRSNSLRERVARIATCMAEVNSSSAVIAAVILCSARSRSIPFCRSSCFRQAGPRPVRDATQLRANSRSSNSARRVNSASVRSVMRGENPFRSNRWRISASLRCRNPSSRNAYCMACSSLSSTLPGVLRGRIFISNSENYQARQGTTVVVFHRGALSIPKPNQFEPSRRMKGFVIFAGRWRESSGAPA